MLPTLLRFPFVFAGLITLISLFPIPALAARYPSYGTLRTTKSGGVLNVVINNTYSTINLFDMHVQSDLANLVETLQANDTDHLPSVLISQLETSLGVNPGAGGGMYLARLIGRGLAFEYVLSSADVDARTAARVGWVNAAFDTSRELHVHVRALAARIAMFPAAGIIATKTGINAVTRPSREEIVNAAQNVIAALLPTPAVQGAFRRFIHVTRNQSIGKMELDYGAEVGRLFE
ncbi:ClpP/crotonase-like domain-containing protein [Mycena olivaceomarginata]|nr:ClpP/crotonase-like domain-containing protein [Mycena olivaceomarginata]